MKPNDLTMTEMVYLIGAYRTAVAAAVAVLAEANCLSDYDRMMLVKLLNLPEEMQCTTQTKTAAAIGDLFPTSAPSGSIGSRSELIDVPSAQPLPPATPED